MRSRWPREATSPGLTSSAPSGCGNPQGQAGQEAWAVYRRNLDGSEPRYSLSNAAEDTMLETLACVGGSRWLIETEFQTEKGDVGLDEYETRSWAGWHHHFGMCLLGGTFLLGLSFLILMMVFRSIVIPLKAIIMNLLSVGATYGILVLVFQKGIGASLFGFQQADVIDAWIPLFLFTILFGLSMDYHVFLLSRIRERYDESGNNTEAVAYGLRSTAGLITGAALIMVVVFGAFASGVTVVNQLVGFGLALAVFLDATLVRSVLVPASMEVLGRGNWYLPPFLRWLPDLRVEGDED